MDIIVAFVICFLIACLGLYLGQKFEDACKHLTEMRAHARANPPQESEAGTTIYIQGPFTYDKARGVITLILAMYEQDNNVRVEALGRDRDGRLQIDARPVRDA